MEKKEWEKLKQINKETSEINKAIKAVTKQYREKLREHKKADPNKRAILQQEFNELSKESANPAQRLLGNMK
jgi:hypothetical protein